MQVLLRPRLFLWTGQCLETRSSSDFLGANAGKMHFFLCWNDRSWCVPRSPSCYNKSCTKFAGDQPCGHLHFLWNTHYKMVQGFATVRIQKYPGWTCRWMWKNSIWIVMGDTFGNEWLQWSMTLYIWFWLSHVWFLWIILFLSKGTSTWVSCVLQQELVTEFICSSGRLSWCLWWELVVWSDYFTPSNQLQQGLMKFTAWDFKRFLSTRNGRFDIEM